MDQKPYKAPRKSLRDHAGSDGDFFFFAAIAVFFGVPGAFAGLVSLFMLVMAAIGVDIGHDVTPFGASMMSAIGAAPCLAIGAIAWAIARRFRE
jgi:hypothetical protein